MLKYLEMCNRSKKDSATNNHKKRNEQQMKAWLILEDGRVYQGESVGAERKTVCEMLRKS